MDNMPKHEPTPPSMQQSWRNLVQPMPLDQKMRLFYRNLLVRVRTRQSCCGHPGQPGC